MLLLAALDDVSVQSSVHGTLGSALILLSRSLTHSLLRPMKFRPRAGTVGSPFLSPGIASHTSVALPLAPDPSDVCLLRLPAIS